MKRTFPLIAILATLSAISGYMMSRASWIGKIGMSLFYKQYNFLKVWWKGALVVFAILTILFVIQGIVQFRVRKITARLIQIVALLAALAGLYLTYHDFMHSFSHRLMKERFHIGVYIFWFSWMLISLYYLFQRNQPTGADKMPIAHKDITNTSNTDEVNL